jgi:hypothetical protein
MLLSCRVCFPFKPVIQYVTLSNIPGWPGRAWVELVPHRGSILYMVCS